MNALRALAGLAGAATVVLVPLLAIGQSNEDMLAAARACGRIADDAERLACLDAALGTAAEVEAATDVEAEVDADAEPEAGANARVDTEVDANVDPVADADAVEAERTVRIVEVRRTGLGETRFVAENGDVWVQRGGSAGRFPPVPFDAVLQPAMGDSYFLSSPVRASRIRVVPAR